MTQSITISGNPNEPQASPARQLGQPIPGPATPDRNPLAAALGTGTHKVTMTNDRIAVEAPRHPTGMANATSSVQPSVTSVVPVSGAAVTGIDGAPVPIRTTATGEVIATVRGLEVPLQRAIAMGIVTDATVRGPEAQQAPVTPAVPQAAPASPKVVPEATEATPTDVTPEPTETPPTAFDQSAYEASINDLGNKLGHTVAADLLDAVFTRVGLSDDDLSGLAERGVDPNTLSALVTDGARYVATEGAGQLTGHGVAPAQHDEFTEWLLASPDGGLAFSRASRGDWHWLSGAIRQFRA